MDPKTGQPPGQDFNPSLSKNPFVNGTLIYRFVWGEPLCVRCGTTGHLPQHCKNQPVSGREQKYLYRLMRAEQERSKAERDLEMRIPTASLAHTAAPMRSRPSTRGGSSVAAAWPHHRPRGLSINDGHGCLRSAFHERHHEPRLPVHQESYKTEPLDQKSLLCDEKDIYQIQAAAQAQNLTSSLKRSASVMLVEPRVKEEGDIITPQNNDLLSEGSKLLREVGEGNVKVEVGSEKSSAAFLAEVPAHPAKTGTNFTGTSTRTSITATESTPATNIEATVTVRPFLACFSPARPARPPPATGGGFAPPPRALRLQPLLLRPRAMGATKHLPEGEAKSIGPHPSTLRVAASYITQSAIDKCLHHAGLDAQEKSLAEAREDSFRLQGVAWLDNVRRALQLPIKTFTTACVYYHKFRLAHPLEDYQWADAAAASLLTSCKTEDTLKKSRDILAAAYNMKQPQGHENLGSDDPMFEAPSRVVIGIERLVLESGGFDFRSRSPHQTLVKISKSLPPSDDLRKVSELAWTVLTDLHRTFAPLKQTSSTLALASLELAVHFSALSSPSNTCSARDDLQNLNLGRWYTTREEVMETLLDALDLYTHSTGSTILGPKYALDALLQIRLALNKECSDASLPRYTVVQTPPSPDNTNGTSNTLRVANGHPTPVSPPQLDTQASLQSNHGTAAATHQPMPEGGGTLRFMLDPQRATAERVEVNRYFVEEWEEYEEEIEVPLPRDRSRDMGRDRYRDTSSTRDRDGRPKGFEDRRGMRDSPRARVPDRELSGREMMRDRDRDAEWFRERVRDRDRERRYDDRRYDDRDRDRYERRDRDRDRRYYDDDRRRDRR